MREVLSLEPGAPERIALQYAKGKIIESRIPNGPNQVMFTLTDDRVAFLPLIAADQIRDAGIKARVPFEITKISAHNYQIRNLTGGARDYTPELAHSIEVANRKKAVEASVNAPTASLPMTTASNLNLQSNGTPHSARRSAEPPPLPTWDDIDEDDRPAPPLRAHAAPASPENGAKTICTKALVSALVASIDGYLLAAEYAKAKGITVSMHLDFDAEDIRQSATSLMIECFKRENGGGR
jgi:hypothetical protein